MKKIVYMFLLAPVIGFSQVNFSTYGAVGDGVTDDTAALQAALDAEDDLFATEGATFKVSSTIFIDAVQSHNIDWNNSTIKPEDEDIVFQIDKRANDGGVVIMTDLTVDGVNGGANGLKMYSRVEMYNVDVINMVSTSTVPDAFQTLVYNDPSNYGTWIFDGCDVTNIDGSALNNNTVAIDGLGAANGYLLQTEGLPSSTVQVIVRNCNVTDVYGEDSQPFFNHDRNGVDVSNSNLSYLIENVVIQGWERRAAKVFSGNNTYKDCDFYADLDSNATGTQDPAGMIAVGTGSGAGGSANNVFDGCRFIGLASGSRDNRIITSDSEGVEFLNCSWQNSADLAINKSLNGDIYVCGAEFGVGSQIYEYSENSDNAEIYLDTDNVYADGSSAIDLTFFSYVETDLDCPAPAGADLYQAEDATLSAATVKSTVGGYNGTGYVDYDNAPGGYIQWTVNAAAAGTYEMEIRYAHAGSTDRPMDIAVNGTTVISGLSFNPTGAWDSWDVQSFTASLNAGSNTIRATGVSSDGGPNVDQFEVIGRTYMLTVNNGTPQSGNYTQGEQVNIAANAAPTGQEFDQWTGDVAYIADVNDSTTTLTMPAGAVSVTATYIPVYYQYQAEDATLSAATVKSTVGGYNGTGYVDYDNATGGYIQWTVSAPAAGVYEMEIRYANAGSTDRQMDIAVNGTTVISGLSFNPTGAWDSWDVQSFTANLNAGSNTIRATGAASEGGPNVDQITISYSGPGSAFGAGSNRSDSWPDEIAQVGFYPNPVTNGLTLYNLPAGSTVIVIDMSSGRKVIERKNPNGDHLRINTVKLDVGMYQVKIISEQEVIKSFKIIKE